MRIIVIIHHQIETPVGVGVDLNGLFFCFFELFGGIGNKCGMGIDFLFVAPFPIIGQVLGELFKIPGILVEVQPTFL